MMWCETTSSDRYSSPGVRKADGWYVETDVYFKVPEPIFRDDYDDWWHRERHLASFRSRPTIALPSRQVQICRRTPIAISGWLARVGKRRKDGR